MDSFDSSEISLQLCGMFQGDGWHDVLYKLDNNQLHGYLNTYAAQAPAEGKFLTVHTRFKQTYAPAPPPPPPPPPSQKKKKEK